MGVVAVVVVALRVHWALLAPIHVIFIVNLLEVSVLTVLFEVSLCVLGVSALHILAILPCVLLLSMTVTIA